MPRCHVCRTVYTRQRLTQKVCGDIGCAVEFTRREAKRKQEKAARKALRDGREKLKRKADHMREAQAAVNRYVRVRDAHLPCISCGRHHNGQYHAGHYLSRGAHPELALDERNIFKQCSPCNTHLSGNQVEMRKGIIARYGVDRVEWLEGPHEPKHYTVDDLKAIKATYKAKLKELEL